MNPLLRKDLICLTPLIRILYPSLTAVAVLLTFIGISYIAIAFLILSGPMLLLHTIAWDRKACWDTYALSTPVLRNELITGKYQLFLLLTGGGALLSLIPVLIDTLSTPARLISGPEPGIILLILIAASLLSGSLICLAIYTQKSGAVTLYLSNILPYLIFAGVVILYPASVPYQDILLQSSTAALILTGLGTLAAWKITEKTYAKKDI